MRRGYKGEGRACWRDTEKRAGGNEWIAKTEGGREDTRCAESR